MTERQIFGDGTPYAFFLNKDGMWQRNPDYKPLIRILFRSFGRTDGMCWRFNSTTPVFGDYFIPFSAN